MDYEVEVALGDGRRARVGVTRKRVKNLNLRLRSDGSLAASVPVGTSRARVEAFLERHAAWIERQLARRERRLEANGAPRGSVPLWGRLVSAQDAGTRDEEALRALYRRELADALPALAAKLEERMGVAARSWSIRDMRTRWGSCTPSTGRIRINLRLAAYPPRCLEAVVAHELTHLMEPSHNARFHALLDAWCPGNREATALLRRPATEVAQRAAGCGAVAGGKSGPDDQVAASDGAGGQDGLATVGGSNGSANQVAAAHEAADGAAATGEADGAGDRAAAKG